MRSRSRRDESGAVAVFVALLFTILFVLAALVVDLGLARDTRRQSQISADSSALAAGNVLYTGADTDGDGMAGPNFTDAVAAATSYADRNFGVTSAEWSNCTDPDRPVGYYVPPGSTACISFDSVNEPTEVRVRVPIRNVDPAFVSVDNVPIGSDAAAALEPRIGLECGLCILGSTHHDLQNGSATVSNGNIHFNGSVNVSANGLVATTGTITVETTATGSYANYTPDPQTNAGIIGDPLAALSLPPAAMSTLSDRTNPCTDGPGIYTGRNLRNAVCVLSPGLYVIHSGVWDLAGNATTLLQGTGVTLYFTCSTGTAPRPCAAGESGATLDASGDGRISIQAPLTGPLRNLSIIYDRQNASTMRLTGNGSGGLTGTVYAPGATVQMNGNGCASTYNAAMIIKDLTMNGNPSCLNMSYVPGLNAQPPPTDLHLSK